MYVSPGLNGKLDSNLPILEISMPDAWLECKPAVGIHKYNTDSPTISRLLSMLLLFLLLLKWTATIPHIRGLCPPVMIVCFWFVLLPIFLFEQHLVAHICNANCLLLNSQQFNGNELQIYHLISWSLLTNQTKINSLISILYIYKFYRKKFIDFLLRNDNLWKSIDLETSISLGTEANYCCKKTFGKIVNRKLKFCVPKCDMRCSFVFKNAQWNAARRGTSRVLE